MKFPSPSRPVTRLKSALARTRKSSNAPENPPVLVPLPERPLRRRQRTTALSQLCNLVSTLFLLLVLLGNTYNTPTLNRWFFIRMDVSNVIPRSVPNASLVNSIAQTLGLRDFYQVGLWNYCEGYNKQGVTYCLTPKTLYHFDPVRILLSQLLAGATIAVPLSIANSLDLAKSVSNWMFGCFMAAICFSALSIFIGWIDLYSRLNSIITSIISFIAGVFTTLAAILATALFVVMKSSFENEPSFNIHGIIGKEMFAFMWIAAGFSIVSFVCHAAMCCCTMSRRKLRRILKSRSFAGAPKIEEKRIEGTRTPSPRESEEEEVMSVDTNHTGLRSRVAIV